MDTNSLKALNFTDLYINIDQKYPACYHYYDPQTQAVRLSEVPSSIKPDIDQLIALLANDNAAESNRSIIHNDMYLRVTTVTDVNHETWAVLHRAALVPPRLEELGFGPVIVPALRKLGDQQGLVVLCSPPGHGKTTTAAAMLYDYLTHQGGVACTIEDPVEYRFGGRHGASGLCYQFEAHENQEWEYHLRQSLRLHPRYIFVGGLHTPEVVNFTLRAATSGQLVITTLNAGTLEEGMEGLLQLGELALGNHAPTMLAVALTAIIHQQRAMMGATQTRLLTIDHGRAADSTRALIRERRIGQLSSIVDQQMAQLGKKPLSQA